MDATFIQKYFFSALLIVALIAGFILFWPFLKLIVLAVVFAILLHPLYRRFHKVVRSSRLSAVLTLLSFVIILCAPIYFLGSIVVGQTHAMYSWIVTHDSIHVLAHDLNMHLHQFFPSMSFNVQNSINGVITNFQAKLGGIFTTTITTVVYFILMLIAMFYFLKDGKAWTDALVELSPLSFKSNTSIITILKKAVAGIFKGYFVIGLAQGIVVGTGFYLFHIPHPALFGLLAAFSSLIPAVGSSLISIPTVIFLLATGRTGTALGYAIWAIFFAITVDNILNPYIVGKQIAIHPLLVLFSIIGGLSLMGPFGIIFGPLITSFIYALISVYKLEMTPGTV